MPSSGFQTCALDRKSTRLNSRHTIISYAVFCLKKQRRGGGGSPPRPRAPPPPPPPSPPAARAACPVTPPLRDISSTRLRGHPSCINAHGPPPDSSPTIRSTIAT